MYACALQPSTDADRHLGVGRSRGQRVGITGGQESAHRPRVQAVEGGCPAGCVGFGVQGVGCAGPGMREVGCGQLADMASAGEVDGFTIYSESSHIGCGRLATNQGFADNLPNKTLKFCDSQNPVLEPRLGERRRIRVSALNSRGNLGVYPRGGNPHAFSRRLLPSETHPRPKITEHSVSTWENSRGWSSGAINPASRHD